MLTLGDYPEVARRLIEAMPGGIVHVGLDGAILSANAEALRILGMSYDQVTSRYVRDWALETLREDGSAFPMTDYPVTRALATGKAQAPVTIGVRKPGGEIAWAVYTAVPVLSRESSVTGAVVTFLDVTEARRTATELQSAQALLRSVLESAPNPIATTDATGHLLFLTHAPGERGELAWARVRPQDREMSKAAFDRVMATGQAESYEIRGDSGRAWLVHVGPRRNGDAVVGVTYVAWDVTQTRALEARVAISDRMASLGTLAAGVAHEVNNPLTYVLANLRWASLQPAAIADEELGERLAAALEGAERIRNVVADLRSFTHAGEERPVLLDVRPLLDAALRMASAEIRHRAKVVKRYAEPPLVMADEARLGQVFLNLVINAAQAIPEGNVEGNAITVVAGEDERSRAFVEVSDTGCGIPENIVGTVFEPFVTTKPRGVGTGLGLYICRNVVIALGGELEVRTTSSAGTTFRVTLPKAAVRSHSPASSGEESEAVPSPRLAILVADDEKAVAEVVRAFLSDHDVEVASSGREALARLDARDFDLVFCDLVMPDVTGMDVYERLCAEGRGREKRVVFMTGGAFTDRARTFLAEVQNDVLEKPFAARDVARAVDRAARR